MAFPEMKDLKLLNLKERFGFFGIQMGVEMREGFTINAWREGVFHSG